MSSSWSNHNTLPTKTRVWHCVWVCGATLYWLVIAVRIGVATEGSHIFSCYFKPDAKHEEFTFREEVWGVTGATPVVG